MWETIINETSSIFKKMRYFFVGKKYDKNSSPFSWLFKKVTELTLAIYIFLLLLIKSNRTCFHVFVFSTHNAE